MKTAAVFVRVYVPLRPAPRPKSVALAAGVYPRTRDGSPVYVPAQTAPVDGWWDSHPDCHTVLSLRVAGAEVPARE